MQREQLHPLVIILMWMVWVLGGSHDNSTDFHSNVSNMLKHKKTILFLSANILFIVSAYMPNGCYGFAGTVHYTHQ